MSKCPHTSLLVSMKQKWLIFIPKLSFPLSWPKCKALRNQGLHLFYITMNTWSEIVIFSSWINICRLIHLSWKGHVFQRRISCQGKCAKRWNLCFLINLGLDYVVFCVQRKFLKHLNLSWLDALQCFDSIEILPTFEGNFEGKLAVMQDVLRGTGISSGLQI